MVPLTTTLKPSSPVCLLHRSPPPRDSNSRALLGCSLPNNNSFRRRLKLFLTGGFCDEDGGEEKRYARGGGFGALILSTTASVVTRARESSFLSALAGNPTFVSGLVAWALAQAMKVFLNFFVERRWDLGMLVSSGGMPSSHSALCTALTTSVAICHGVSDALFPVCLGFTLIVMYDATGVRRHAGLQAALGPFMLIGR